MSEELRAQVGELVRVDARPFGSYHRLVARGSTSPLAAELLWVKTNDGPRADMFRQPVDAASYAGST